MKITMTLLAYLLFASCFAQAPQVAHVTIGDPAPAFHPVKWFKGTPVAQFEKGKLYVVEFWATWCHPCVENIPHLTELAKKYKDQVTIVGCDVWENQQGASPDPLKKSAEFVKEQGSKMEYNVAADGPANTIAKAWLTAAGEGGIPCSFIINGDGKVAWIGHPAKMETALEQVIAGDYDLAKARSDRETEQTLLRPIDDAVAAADYPRMVKTIDAALAKKPDLQYKYMYPLLVALFHIDVPRGISTAQGVLKEANGSIGAYNMVSSIFASQEGLSHKAYQYGLQATNEGLKLNEQLPLFLGMKAAICYNLGDKAEAVKVGQEAVTAAETDPNVRPEFKSLLKKNLEKFKAHRR